MSIQTTAGATALERLPAEQRLQLDSMMASFALEGSDFGDEGTEVLARYMLEELSFDETVSTLDKLQS